MAIKTEIGERSMTDILEQVIDGNEVIFESADGENSDDAEVDEIVEIIEEIVEEEEVEENGEKEEAQNNQSFPQKSIEEEEEMMEEEYLEEFQDIEKRKMISSKEKLEEYITDNIIEKSQSEDARNRVGNGVSNTDPTQILAYHVEEDWEDEELEQAVQSQELANNHAQAGNSRSEVEYEQHLSNVDSDIQHEIVKNSENNLVYTVLNPKKPSSSAKTNNEARYTDSQYVKMERIDDEGVYYEGGDLDALYVNNTTSAEPPVAHYEFADVSMEHAQQEWEPETEPAPEPPPSEQEGNPDQIFLHEDEDGQLYFKDDNGILQPVYLTEDGNYAIASGEEQETQGPPPQTMEEDKQQAEEEEEEEEEEEDNYIPQMDFSRLLKGKKMPIMPPPTNQEMEGEDSTVTISLIISEDEHGQKRTQVIIPTADNTKCDICNKTFKTSLQLLKHNRLKHAREEDITTRNFPCDLCPKRYPDQNSLARHRKTHTGNRFQCLECHKSFQNPNVLRRHLSQHNPNSKPLPCIYCGRRFLDQVNLDRHELSHRAAEKTNHPCDVCHKVFMNASDLNLHLKTHDPDRKFDCEKGENEEVLACDVCGITYKFMSSLTRHMVTSHMNPEKMRQQAEEQRRKRENNYKRYLENRRLYETQRSGGYAKRTYHYGRSGDDQDEEDQV
ncbi:zinc finger protein 311-like isoform X2 [Belonocnema kinseyi]|uniref:zinc finger protein 311-like isoform X2 n=1 Tax=Belonocnema kinseyi TaxID=2817044 RepID=UPI00143DD092|nr:zinc finger protein 311-like isoform X2 [Belonocnema kinseyi]